MAACRQTWCWGRSWEFYILIHRQQKRTVYHNGHNLNIWDLKVCLHSDTLPPTWARLQRVLLHYGPSIQTHESVPAIPIQITTNWIHHKYMSWQKHRVGGGKTWMNQILMFIFIKWSGKHNLLYPFQYVFPSIAEHWWTNDKEQRFI